MTRQDLLLRALLAGVVFGGVWWLAGEWFGIQPTAFAVGFVAAWCTYFGRGKP